METAPHTPEPIGAILNRCLRVAKKRCYKCGLVWDSFAFMDHEPTEVIDGATCHQCMDAEDQATLCRVTPLRLAGAPHEKPAVELELRMPRRSPDAVDD